MSAARPITCCRACLVHPSRRLRPVVALAAATVSVAIAACGGTAVGSVGATTAFARCMRSHGVPGFSDLPSAISGPRQILSGQALSPTARRAQQRCRKDLHG